MGRESLKLTLIRHTSLNIDAGLCYVQTDVDVPDGFEQEVRVTKAKLPQSIDAVFYSLLQRCIKLAHTSGLENIPYDDRLKELYLGDWEMQAWDNLPKAYFDEWAQNYGYISPSNGETFGELQARGMAFINAV
jgi:alpha-ribazole phosphatase